MKESAVVMRIGIGPLAARLGVDRSTIWRWYQAGTFPRPHYLGERRVWLLAAVEEWERERMARSPGTRGSARNAERLSATAKAGRRARREGARAEEPATAEGARALETQEKTG